MPSNRTSLTVVMNIRVAATAVLLLLPAKASAGLYYSGETIAELPSQLRGFLLHHRALRNIGVKPTTRSPASPLRLKYEAAAGTLERTARQRPLTADELADLGAL